MEASVLVPEPKVPLVPVRLAEMRCRATEPVAVFKSDPKSWVTLARIHALDPLSATSNVPSCEEGPAVSATAPVIAPVPSALDAPPRNTSTLVKSSGPPASPSSGGQYVGRSSVRRPPTKRFVRTCRHAHSNPFECRWGRVNERRCPAPFQGRRPRKARPFARLLPHQ